MLAVFFAKRVEPVQKQANEGVYRASREAPQEIGHQVERATVAALDKALVEFVGTAIGDNECRHDKDHWARDHHMAKQPASVAYSQKCANLSQTCGRSSSCSLVRDDSLKMIAMHSTAGTARKNGYFSNSDSNILPRNVENKLMTKDCISFFLCEYRFPGIKKFA